MAERARGSPGRAGRRTGWLAARRGFAVSAAPPRGRGPGRSRRDPLSARTVGVALDGAPGRAACRAPDPVLLTAAAASSANPGLRDDLARVLGVARTAEWSVAVPPTARCVLTCRAVVKAAPARAPTTPEKATEPVGQTRYPRARCAEQSNRQATTTPLFGRASRPRQVPVSRRRPNPASLHRRRVGLTCRWHRPHPAAAGSPQRQRPTELRPVMPIEIDAASIRRHPQPADLPTGARPDGTLDFRAVRPVMTEGGEALLARVSHGQGALHTARRGRGSGDAARGRVTPLPGPAIALVAASSSRRSATRTRFPAVHRRSSSG